MARKKAVAKAAGRKERIPAQIPAELLQKARRAAYWTPGMTLSSLVEQALEREIARLEKQRGGPFPENDVELRAGRPIKP